MSQENQYSCDKKGWERNTSTTWERFCADAVQCAADLSDPGLSPVPPEEMQMRLLFQRVRRIEVALEKKPTFQGRTGKR